MIHFSSGGYAKKNGFRFELKYGAFLDGEHQENPWYLYVSRNYPGSDIAECTYTERSVRFATREDAGTFCEKVANGEISISELKAGEQNCLKLHKAQVLARAEDEVQQYFDRLAQLGVPLTSGLSVYLAFNSLSDDARALATNLDYVTRNAISRAQAQHDQPAPTLSATLGDWLNTHQKGIDIQLVDQDGTDHFLSGVYYLDPSARNANGLDYTDREKWLMTLPVKHISDENGNPVAVLSTEFTKDQTDFLLGLPQFDSTEWGEKSLRAVYANADFSVRLNHLQTGAPLERFFDGECMDTLAGPSRAVLCKMLDDHPAVYVTHRQSPDAPAYAYALTKGENGHLFISQPNLPIRETAPGEGLTSTLDGKLHWLRHKHARDALNTHEPSRSPVKHAPELLTH